MGIQIIPRLPTTSDRAFEALGTGINRAADEYVGYKQRLEKENKLKKENEVLSEQTGIDFSKITDPKVREKIAELSFKEKNRAFEFANELTAKKIEQKTVAKALRGEQLTPEEMNSLPASTQISLNKAFQQSKEPKQALTEKQVPLEVSSKIDQVLKDNPDASADDLRLKMDQAGIPPVYSNPYTENRRRQEESASGLKNEKIKMALTRDNEFLKEGEKIRLVIPTEEASLDAMEDAVISGDQSFFSANNLAEMTGLELFRDAAGGQIKTAGKTFLINNVSKFGGRPNQYIEQQISDALTKVGRSKAANLTSIQLLRFDSDIKKEFLRKSDEVSDEDYKPGSLGKIVQNKMKNYVENKQKQLTEKLKFIKNYEREIDETPNGHISMIDPDGNLVYIPEKEIEEAMIHGASKI